MKKLILLCAGVLFLAACSRDNHPENSLVKKAGAFTFMLRPYSSERLAAVNYANTGLSQASRDSIIKEYDQFLCFVLEISIDGFGNSIENYSSGPAKELSYEKRSDYYLFGMQHDLKLLERDHETPCTIYYYERMNEITSANRFVIGFKKGGSAETVLEYNNPCLDCGKIRFHLDNSHLAIK